MKAWSVFLPDVVPELPGAPYPLVEHHMRNVVIDFCQRTQALVVDLAPLDAVAEQMTYALVFPTRTELVELKTVRFRGDKLTPKGETFLERRFGDWQSAVGMPDYYLQDDTRYVMLVAAPDTDETAAIRVRASIKPTALALGIEDWIYQQYRLPLAAGLKAMMFAMPDRVWSKPDNVAINLAKYETAVAAARPKANSGHVKERPRFSGSFC